MSALTQQGYASARQLTRAHARTFYLASFLLFGRRRKAAFALYALCRRLDDLVDGGEGAVEGRGELPERLGRARAAIAALYADLPELAAPELRREVSANDAADAPFDQAELAAFRDAVHRFGLPERPFQELVSGMEMDLTRTRYATFRELDLYCYRVAGVVGLMMAPVLGCLRRDALEAAADLGRAMQLTNILRDVREDLARGRIYLPQDELAAFGLSESDLRAGKLDDRFTAFMRCQIARARSYYARGAAGLGALGAFGARRMVTLMAAAYGDILRAIEQRGYDVFRGRAVVPTARKALFFAGALLAPGQLVRAPEREVPEPLTVPVLRPGGWS